MAKGVIVETSAGKVTLRQRGSTWYARKQHGRERHEFSLGTTDLDEAAARAEEVMPAKLLGILHFGYDAAALPADKVYRRLFQTAKRRALARGMAYTLTEDEEAAIVLRAGNRCEVSGIQFSLATNADAFRAPYRPSLDRIKASGGYTLGNVRLVCTAVNWALADWGVGVFDRVATEYVARKLLRAVGQDAGQESVRKREE